MEQKANIAFASEKTYPNDAVQLNLKGSYRTDGNRGSNAILNMRTYIRTLGTEDDLDRLTDQIKWYIIGFCESYKKGVGIVRK